MIGSVPNCVAVSAAARIAPLSPRTMFVPVPPVIVSSPWPPTTIALPEPSVIWSLPPSDVSVETTASMSRVGVRGPCKIPFAGSAVSSVPTQVM